MRRAFSEKHNGISPEHQIGGNTVGSAYLGTSMRRAFSEKHNGISPEHQIGVFCSDHYCARQIRPFIYSNSRNSMAPQFSLKNMLDESESDVV
jgi:hypothetical protein